MGHCVAAVVARNLKRVHKLVDPEYPKVFECGVYSDGVHRYSSVHDKYVTCRPCLAQMKLKAARPTLIPCPCKGYFEKIARGEDPCAKCAWRG